MDEARTYRLIDVAITIARQWMLLVLVPLLAALCIATLLLQKDETYTAVARVLPPQHNKETTDTLTNRVGGTSALANSALSVKNPTDLYVGILSSRSILERVVKQQKLNQYYGIPNHFRAIKKLGDSTKIRVAKDGIINIEVRDSSPTKAAELTNAYIASFYDLAEEISERDSTRRNRYFGKLVGSARDRMKRADAALRQTEEDTGITRLSGQEQAIVRSITELTALINVTSSRLQSMRAYATNENPMVRRLTAEIQNMRRQKNQLESHRKKLETGAPEEKEKNNRDLLVAVDDVPSAIEETVIRRREVKFSEIMLELVERAHELSKVDTTRDVILLQVLDYALPPLEKSGPKITLTTAAAAFATFVWLVIFIVVIDAIRLDTRPPGKLHPNRKSTHPERQMKAFQKKWLSNVTALWLMQLASYLLPLVTLPYLVRTLSLDGYGRLVFAASVLQFVVLFVDSGFNAISQRDVARSDNSPLAISRALATSIVARGLVAIAGIGLIGALVWWRPSWQNDIGLLLASSLLVAGTLAFPQWLFVALQDTRPMVICHVLGRCISVVLIFSAVRSADDLILAATLQASATLLSGILALYWLRRNGQLVAASTTATEVRRLIVMGARIGLPAFMAAAANNATVFLLGLAASPALVGVYAAIEKVIRAAGGLFNAVIQAAFPILCNRYGTADFNRLARGFIAAAVAVAGIGAGISWLWAEPIVVIAFGQKFASHGYLLAIIAPSMVGTCLALCGAHLILLARGQDNRLSLVQSVAAVMAWLTYVIAARAGDPGWLALSVTWVELATAGLIWLAATLPDKHLKGAAA